MGYLERLDLYLRAQLEGYRAATPPTGEPEPHPFVTISRQAGAGGHSLARTMVEVFARQPDKELFGGWQVFDQKLCDIVAGDPKYSKSLDSLLAEEYRKPANDFFHQVLRSTVDQDFVMARVFEIVRALASIGKSIIVGRGGSQVTMGMGPGVHLRIVAPEETRIARVMQVYDLNERQARNETRRLDAYRARLIKAHFKVDIDDPMGYDAVWNTGATTVDEIAETTAVLLRMRAAARQSA